MDERAPFIEVVGKDAGLDELLAAIDRLFDGRVPQTHRAIADHIETSVRSYMWDFVAKNWTQFQNLTAQPEFLRLLLARLASELGNNLSPILERVYGDGHRDPAPDTAHPAAYYMKPPVGTDALLGDLRTVDGALLFVLWPSCDMVLREGVCKVDSVLCAKTIRLEDTPEFGAWTAAKDAKAKNSARDALKELFRNRRKGTGVQSERYHFLPKVWDHACRLRKIVSKVDSL